mmetsp:Transcript_11515/g.18733  ORF Transcript_11515/g.18733 Transcript_11515/m.18733 type:complete len:207 (+) Transcript_11515:498-1118(+)
MFDVFFHRPLWLSVIHEWAHHHTSRRHSYWDTIRAAIIIYSPTNTLPLVKFTLSLSYSLHQKHYQTTPGTNSHQGHILRLHTSFVDQILECQCDIMSSIIKVVFRNKSIIRYEYISHITTTIAVFLFTTTSSTQHAHLLRNPHISTTIPRQKGSTVYPKKNLLRWPRCMLNVFSGDCHFCSGGFFWGGALATGGGTFLFHLMIYFV